MDEELAEFIGIYVGDGSLHIREEKHSYEFKIVGNPNNEKEYYLFVAGLSSKITKKLIQPKMLDGGRSIGVRFCSKELSDNLTKIAGNKNPQSLKERIPKEILENEKLAIAFLRGFFDTDGSFVLKRRHKETPYYPVFSFSQAKGEIVKQVFELLQKLGIRGALCNYRVFDSRTNKNYEKTRIDIYGVENTKKWFETVGSHNPKITSKYAKYLNRPLGA